jgi:hypothetical protein
MEVLHELFVEKMNKMMLWFIVWSLHGAISGLENVGFVLDN